MRTTYFVKGVSLYVYYYHFPPYNLATEQSMLALPIFTEGDFR
ncbi:hypothetical protein pah_c180o078 [Parachlamydia acanthamoebae str. Hall's coccus]|nr:hypothetical protein pah_c180o078 [Parachlamydia acanthamoebae str. Hall's coccus]